MVKMNRVWGKVVGGVLGLAFGGPLGAAFGVIVGHAHDNRIDQPGGDNFWDQISGFTPGDLLGRTQQAVFTMGVIVLGAKMAKVDGRVTREEIAAFKRVFQVPESEEARVGRLFDKARLSADGFEPYAFRLAQVFRNNAAVLEEILSGLFIIAAADSAGLSAAELRFLERVAVIFGFGAQAFARIAARSGVRMKDRVPSRDESYAVLGLRMEATVTEIKATYRALIRKHHPDKLLAQGMPPEFIATANEKMKRINAAYDTICRARGIK